MITRRNLLVGASVVALVVAVGGIEALTAAQPAAAQSATAAELLVPPPLGDRVLGKDDAPVTIVEYASMTCPHCAHFHETTYPELKKRYIDTGKVRFIFREFPLDELAVAASMMARCAGKDDSAKAMALIDVLFASQEKWAASRTNPVPILQQIGKQAGMTEKAFDECLKDQTLYNNIMAVRERGSKEYKVESTPTLFVNGKLQKGGATIEDLDKLIVPLLPKS